MKIIGAIGVILLLAWAIFYLNQDEYGITDSATRDSHNQLTGFVNDHLQKYTGAYAFGDSKPRLILYIYGVADVAQQDEVLRYIESLTGREESQKVRVIFYEKRVERKHGNVIEYFDVNQMRNTVVALQ